MRTATFWHTDGLCCPREKKELMTGTRRDWAAPKIHVGLWEILSTQAVLSQGLFSSVRGSFDAWELGKCWSSVLGWMTLVLWETEKSYFDSGFVNLCMAESFEALEPVSKHNSHICNRYQQCLHDFVQETSLKCSWSIFFLPSVSKSKGQYWTSRFRDRERLWGNLFLSGCFGLFIY